MRVGAAPGGHVQQRGFRVPPAPRPARPSGFFSGIGHAFSHIGAAAQHATHSASTPHRAARAGTDVQSGHGYPRANIPRAPAGHATGAPLFAGAHGVRQNPQQRAAVNKILRTWETLRSQGLLPASSRFPNIVFDNHETPKVGAYVTNVGGAPTTLHVPPTFLRGLTQTSPLPLQRWANTAVVHELAHTAQNAATTQSKGLMEGDAQAYAQRAEPRVFKTGPQGPGGYKPYVDQVNGREPNDWIMRNQFNPGGHAPMINMPGTPSFRVALRKLGGATGRAASETGIKGAYADQFRQRSLNAVR